MLVRTVIALFFVAPCLADCGCTSDETCCQDSSGYACCIIQSTFCAAPNASKTKEFPARCCPQWTIGCETGSVGCCDPARPWQRNKGMQMTGGTMLHSNTPTVKPQTASPNVFALFSSSLANDLNCLSINAETGSIESLVPVQGPAKQYFSKLYGESTREYPFDSKRGRFHFLDIDQKGATSSSPITLYSIDPSTGDSTATTITGATGFVVSFVYHAESASLIFATGFREASQFDFYTLDPDTATATAISTVHRGESESSSAAFYSPYITEVSSSGKTVLRLGYKEVVVGNSPGLGSTPLDGNATATWQSVPGPANEEFFYSLVRRPGTDKFLSLTPSTRLNHTFSVVEWDTTGDDPKVVLEVPDAHPPSTSSTGVLGYVVDTATADSYAALVVKKGPVPLGLEDKWELISLDLNSGEGNSKAITGKGFDPLGAETVTVSGIGIKTA